MRSKFIQQAILAIGVGFFVETEHNYIYYTALDFIWATKSLNDWWINGEYVESPVAWALANC